MIVLAKDTHIVRTHRTREHTRAWFSEYLSDFYLRRCQRVANHVPALSSGLADTTPQVVENTSASCLPGWRRGSSWVFQSTNLFLPCSFNAHFQVRLPSTSGPLSFSRINLTLECQLQPSRSTFYILLQEIRQAIPWHLITLLWNHTYSQSVTQSFFYSWSLHRLSAQASSWQ